MYEYDNGSSITVVKVGESNIELDADLDEDYILIDEEKYYFKEQKKKQKGVKYAKDLKVVVTEFCKNDVHYYIGEKYFCKHHKPKKNVV
jgi:hypothetical protein